ncbi:dynamin-2A [Cryptomeria japonica]|uniref:dynamin-2A n=1 Tax=Cryptomeria japonica TaxID=3369 RepID=UPI0027DA6A19|nr:dynamin-2A [Cryptomeria japonica]
MEAMENLIQLSESMQQAAALLNDEDTEESSSQTSTFLNVVALGNVGAGKSAVLNSLIGHPLLPTGENGATRAPIIIDLQRDSSVNSRAIFLQIENKTQPVSASALRHSLQDKLSKGLGIPPMKLRTSTSPPLKLIDLPGLDQRVADDSMISNVAEHNDAILLVVVPASQAPEISSSRALKMALEFDPDGTRTIGVISKIDQASSDQKSLAAVQALLLGQGPRTTQDIPWVALIGQSVAIASAQGSVGGESSLETAWRAESESLKAILTGAPQTKLGRIALVETLARQIRKRMKLRLPSILSGLEGRSQVVEDELVRLGEQLVQSAEGTRAIALELCREFEDKFLQHIATGEGGGWKVVACFEGNFPNRIKQLPLDRHFDIVNVKKVVLEADGYQPYLISPEKGLRALIKGVLELAKEPARMCVDEVHRVLIDIVSTAASSTPGLGRYPPFKREVVAIASTALDNFRVEAKKMVVSLVDMERAFVPPQHFIRLVQRRLDRQRREDEMKNRASKKGHDAEQSLLNRATSPQPGNQQTGGTLKSMKDKSNQADKDNKETSVLQTAGPDGELTAGYLLKKSAKTNGWSRRWFVLNEKSGKLGYTRKPEERHFRGVINLEECIIEEVTEDGTSDSPAPAPAKSSSKDSKKANGADAVAVSLAFKITNKVSYKTVLKAHSALLLKAESIADKTEWVSKIRNIIQPSKNVSTKGLSPSDSGSTMRSSHSDGSLDTMARRPVDPEEELRMMAQEVRGYVEAVLNSLAANVPKCVVLCQVEKAKEEMLTQLYSSISSQSSVKIEELLQEDQNAKRKRERFKKQASLLSRLTRQLSVHDVRASSDNFSANGASGSGPSTPVSTNEDWRVAFDTAANGPSDYSNSVADSPSINSSRMNGHSRRLSDPAQNGEINSSRRTPNRLPPPPPSSTSSMYRY